MLSLILKIQGKNVAVVGGGNCTCYAADYLSQFVENYIFNMIAQIILKQLEILQKIMTNSTINVIWNTNIVDAFGLDKIEKINWKHYYTPRNMARY